VVRVSMSCFTFLLHWYFVDNTLSEAFMEAGHFVVRRSGLRNKMNVAGSFLRMHWSTPRAEWCELGFSGFSVLFVLIIHAGVFI
jgi:hypothetical protein